MLTRVNRQNQLDAYPDCVDSKTETRWRASFLAKLQTHVHTIKWINNTQKNTSLMAIYQLVNDLMIHPTRGCCCCKHTTKKNSKLKPIINIKHLLNRRRLRSASTTQLDIPSIRLPTVGSRAFPVAGASVWNSLPDDVTSAPSLPTFRRHLKRYLFCRCYNTIWCCLFATLTL